jgi:protein-S-isoprenylcysteine O-methyltransferase Ste14
MTFQFKVIVFIVASAGIVWASWASLRNFRSHGFYRFFAAVISTFALTMTARIEETENLHFFGLAYQDYMKQTKMFIPFLF